MRLALEFMWPAPLRSDGAGRGGVQTVRPDGHFTGPGDATDGDREQRAYPNLGTEQSIMDYGQAITQTSC
jgi:hypothetical protein